MNQIIKNFLNEHIMEYGIDNWDDTIAFEHFVNRCMVTKYVTDRFDPSDIMTDDGEIGIDGVAVIINGLVILTLQEAQNIIQNGNIVDIEFVFIQSKTSERFDGGEMSLFAKGVRHFFEPKDKRPETNEKMEKMIAIKDYLYQKAIMFEKNPSLNLFYVCCGKWNDDNNLSATINQDKDLFETMGLFDKVNYYPVDNDMLITSYKQLRRKINKSFVMEKRLPFFDMPGIKEAYFGLVRCKDIANILADEYGRLFSNIFEDNVRDFQGYNPVNSEIKNTIASSSQERFAVLNNGITIVAKDIKTEGDKVTIYDYQIINGCQSSHVLFDNKEILSDKSYVFVKLISVGTEDVLDEIVYTSNRQTEVKYEAFSAAGKFHKYLQEYYKSVDEDYRLYYERRSKQFDMDPSVSKNKIVSLAAQTKDFVAIFQNEPHSVHRYYGEILEAYKKRIYGNDDYPEPYYAAAYLYYLVDVLLKKNKIDKEFKEFKYHICYAIKILVCGKKILLGNSREIKKSADKLIALSRDENQFNRVLNTACSCIHEAVSKENNDNSTLLRSKDFTKKLTETLGRYVEKIEQDEFLKKGDVVTCQVTAIREYNVEVDIRTDDSRNKGSIHISQVADRHIRNLTEEFAMGEIIQAKIISDDADAPFGWSVSVREIK